ncbi:hypothetical protein GWK47_023520 [Chionoecetes opilio]|uniref:Uncharacterized protein n=1 Tax=Chionoecetes opilio TaxID=41210 RepID=A0A8J5BTY0_CHIOP|nr:hypothetical protein GWK47_023520 [Chionoecetes opilio]
MQGEERVRLTQEYAVSNLVKLDVDLPDTPPPHQHLMACGVFEGVEVCGREGMWAWMCEGVGRTWNERLKEEEEEQEEQEEEEEEEEEEQEEEEEEEQEEEEEEEQEEEEEEEDF